MVDNPYQSPNLETRLAKAKPSRPRYGPWAMVGWGLVAGILLGSTYGAIGGGVLGLTGFFLNAVVGTRALVHETGLVVLVAAGTIAGAVAGVFSGAVFGPPLAVVASRPWCQTGPSKLALLSSVIAAPLAAVVGSVGGGTAGPLGLAAGAVVGAVAGLFGGQRLARLLWELAWRDLGIQ